MRTLLNIRDHRRDYTQLGVARIIRILTLLIFCLCTYYRDHIVHIYGTRRALRIRSDVSGKQGSTHLRRRPDKAIHPRGV